MHRDNTYDVLAVRPLRPRLVANVRISHATEVDLAKLLTRGRVVGLIPSVRIARV